MKRIFILAIVAVVLMFSMQAEADLFDRGTDINGNHLFYDDDLDITWYDFMKSPAPWDRQVDWATNLVIELDGEIFDNWRLPTTPDTCSGYDCTSSEMGHLYYTELGNPARLVNPNPPLTDFGDFVNLMPYGYLSTEVDAVDAWYFYFGTGNQFDVPKVDAAYALAVRSGDVLPAVVPEPISSILFLTGGAILGFSRFRKKQISV